MMKWSLFQGCKAGLFKNQCNPAYLKKNSIILFGVEKAFNKM